MDKQEDYFCQYNCFKKIGSNYEELKGQIGVQRHLVENLGFEGSPIAWEKNLNILLWLSFMTLLPSKIENSNINFSGYGTPGQIKFDSRINWYALYRRCLPGVSSFARSHSRAKKSDTYQSH